MSSTSSKPDASIIICTRNRAEAIISCLGHVNVAMMAASSSGASVECVVVDNASTDDTAARVMEWSRQHADVQLRLIADVVPGLAHARNVGVASARGELLIFTDDDCHVAEDFVVRALDYHRKDNEPTIRGGRIELGDPDDLPITVRTVDVVERWVLSERTCRQRVLRGGISGCNMAVPRSVFDLVGVFDEKLGSGTKIGGSEDTDLYYRAYLAGIPIEYVPDMTVHHFHGRRSAEQGFQIMSNYNIGQGALYAKYMFRHIDFVRPFAWSFKLMLREIWKRQSLYMPEVGMSYLRMIYYNLVGIKRYFIG